MNHNRLPEIGTLFFSVLYFMLMAIMGMAATARAHEPEETLPVNISVRIQWEMDEGYNIRKGHFSMNANSTLTLDRAGSGLDHTPKMMPLALKYKGRSFTGNYQFEETLTQKDPRPPHCSPLLETYSGSNSFSYSLPESYDSINLFLRRFGMAKSQIKSGMSGAGAQQFLAQLQSRMGIPLNYYEFAAGGVSGRHTVFGKKRKTDKDECPYEDAETKIGVNVIGLRFPIPEQGPMEGEQTWRAKLDGPPRDFSIKLSRTGVGREKPFRPENAGKGGNATYTISWNFKEVSPGLKIRRLKEGQWVDITHETQTVAVGEQIRLAALAMPGSNDSQQGRWSISGKTVKQFLVTHEGENISGRPLDLGEDDLNNPEITFYWWDKSHKPWTVTYTTTVQGKPLTAEAGFDVKEPDIRVRTEIPPGNWIIANTPDYDSANKTYTDYVNLIYDPEDRSKDFSIRFSHGPLPAQFPGETQYVQIVTRAYQREETGMESCMDGEDLEGIDNTYPYSKGPETTDRPGVPMPFECHQRDEMGRCVQLDTNVPSDYWVKALTEMHFEMILMFKPAKPQSIFVPLKVVRWSWIADLYRATWDDPWAWNNSRIEINGNSEAKKFPEWDHTSPEEVPLGPCK